MSNNDLREPLSLATRNEPDSLHPVKKSIRSVAQSILGEPKLGATEEELSKSNKNLGKVIFLAVSFLLMFSAFNSASVLITPIYEQLGYTNFGKISTLLIYIAFGLNDFLAPFELRALSQKYSLFVGSTGYTFFMLGGLLLTYCNVRHKEGEWYCANELIIGLNSFGSVACGLGAALLWLAMASYIDNCANEFNKGKFFGVFWAIFQSSFIIGNTLGAYLLKQFKQDTYFFTMLILALVASISFLFLPNVRPFNKASNTNSTSLPMWKDISLRIRGIKKFAVMRSFRPLLPYFMFSGFSVAIYSTFEANIIKTTLGVNPSDSLVNERTEIAFVGQGIISVINSYVIGKVFDLFSVMKLINITNFGFLVAMVLAATGFRVGVYFIALGMVLVWAWGDSSMRTMTNAIIAKDYKGRLEAFAASRVFTEIGVIIGTVLSIVLGAHTYVLIGVIIGVTLCMQVGVAQYDAKSITEEDIKEENSDDRGETNLI